MEMQGRYCEVDSVRTYYEWCGDGERTLVCVHSAGMDSIEWRFNLPYFGAIGYRAIALDLPGHGKSLLKDWTPIEEIHRYAEFVWSFVQGQGIRRPVVMGCSIGGCIALDLGVHHGAELQAVVALSATDHNPTMPAGGLEMAREDAGMPGWPDRAAIYAASSTGSRSLPERTTELAWRQRCGDPKVANADLRAWNKHDLRGKLKDIQCPTLVLLGEDDFFIPLERVEGMRRELAQGEVIVVEGIGHYPMMEWADFNQAISKWIEKWM